jgi:hypothetical protein
MPTTEGLHTHTHRHTTHAHAHTHAQHTHMHTHMHTTHAHAHTHARGRARARSHTRTSGPRTLMPRACVGLQALRGWWRGRLVVRVCVCVCVCVCVAGLTHASWVALPVVVCVCVCACDSHAVVEHVPVKLQCHTRQVREMRLCVTHTHTRTRRHTGGCCGAKGKGKVMPSCIHVCTA